VPLLAVPNFSEGRDGARISAIETTLSRGVTLLDSHSDVDHNRSVFTLAGEMGPLRDVLVSAAEEAIETLDMNGHEGVHPAIGALDVCPIVWLNPADRGAARTEAIEVAEQIGGLGVPVFLYGELATGPERVERAYFRNGGFGELWLRMEDGELRSDYGSSVPHRTAGATLVTARPPLAAFNIELDTGDADLSRAVAASLREAGGGLPGVRAIGLPLSSGRAQVSANVHDPLAVPLGTVVERVRELAAPLGARPVEAELIGLVPEGALAGYPDDVPIRAFDPARHVIERRLAASTD
jgi:glutamate formiminotransferase